MLRCTIADSSTASVDTESKVKVLYSGCFQTFAFSPIQERSLAMSIIYMNSRKKTLFHSLLNQFFCHRLVRNSTKTLALSSSHCHGELSFVTSQRGGFPSHRMFYSRHQWINVDNNEFGWIKLLKGATKQWRNNQAHDFSWRARPLCRSPFHRRVYFNANAVALRKNGHDMVS